MEATEMQGLMDQLSVEPEKPVNEAEETSQDDAEEPQDDIEPDAELPDGEADSDDADEAETAEDAEDADQDEDDDQEDDTPDPAELHTVSVDGEKKQVTLDELKRSYSGQSYIQKGMQEAAQMRKQLEAASQQTQQVTSALMQMYQQAQTQGFKAPPTPPSPEMSKDDPIGYMQARADYETQAQAFQAEQMQMRQIQEYQNQQSNAQRQQRLQAEVARLVQRIPELGDAQKAPEIRNRLLKVGREHYGFSTEQLGQIEESAALEVLYDAVRYRELQSGKKAKAADKTQGARPYVKPTSRKTTKTGQRDAALRKAKRSQDKHDFADLL